MEKHSEDINRWDGWMASMPEGIDFADIERLYFVEILKRNAWNRIGTALETGLSLRTVRNKITKIRGMGVEIPSSSHGQPSHRRSPKE